jgi:hypothetical protein
MAVVSPSRPGAGTDTSSKDTLQVSLNQSERNIAAEIQNLLDSPNDYGLTKQLTHLKVRKTQLETLKSILKHLCDSEKLSQSIEDSRSAIADIEEAKNNLTESKESINKLLNLIYPAQNEWDFQPTKDDVALDANRKLGFLYRSINLTQKKLGICRKNQAGLTQTLNPSHLGDALDSKTVETWVKAGQDDVGRLTDGLIRSVAAMLRVPVTNDTKAKHKIQEALNSILESLRLNRQQSSL